MSTSEAKDAGSQSSRSLEISFPLEIFVRYGPRGEEKRVYRAIMRSLDHIELDGAVYASLSTAALVVTGTHVNGWRFWNFEKNGQVYPVDILRQEGHQPPERREKTRVKSQVKPISSNKVSLRDGFFQQVSNYLQLGLTGDVNHGEVKLIPGKNSIQVSFPDFPRSHYAISLRRDFDEVAFHFEADREENLARLAHVQAHVDQFSQVLGYQIVAEPWRSQHARLAIEMQPAARTSTQAEIYADLFAKFITETFAVLNQAFVTTRARRGRSLVVSVDGQNQEAHTILDQQISHIREYLRGRVERPSDELLCEWVHFCYTFQLFREGAELFSLINAAAVDAWPYERTKRIARVCRIRAEML